MAVATFPTVGYKLGKLVVKLIKNF